MGLGLALDRSFTWTTIHLDDGGGHEGPLEGWM